MKVWTVMEIEEESKPEMMIFESEERARRYANEKAEIHNLPLEIEKGFYCEWSSDYLGMAVIMEQRQVC